MNGESLRIISTLTKAATFPIPIPWLEKPPLAAHLREPLGFHDAKVEPEGYVLYADAAFQLFDQAATKAKSTKYADLEKALRSGTFDTVIGKLSFDAKGNSSAPAFVVYQWKDGKYDYVKK